MPPLYLGLLKFGSTCLRALIHVPHECTRRGGFGIRHPTSCAGPCRCVFSKKSCHTLFGPTPDVVRRRSCDSEKCDLYYFSFHHGVLLNAVWSTSKTSLGFLFQKKTIPVFSTAIIASSLGTGARCCRLSSVEITIIPFLHRISASHVSADTTTIRGSTPRCLRVAGLSRIGRKEKKNGTG